MSTVLIVEPDRFLAESVAGYISEHLALDCEIIDTLEVARERFERNGSHYRAVVLNLELSPGNYAPFEKIPTISITGSRPTSARKVAFAGNVLDYIPDYSIYNLEYMIQLLKRGLFAESSKMLIVEDEPAYLNLMRNLLAEKGYTVIAARTSKEAFAYIESEPDISMIIADGDICGKNEYQLIRTIRGSYGKNQLSILALCERQNDYQRITLLRNGASDCIDKPFRIEEFQVRVMLNLQLVEITRELTDRANRDFLTQLYNRSYFYEIGRNLYENSKRGSLRLALAMIDIDYLKTINDGHGHLWGDRAIKLVAERLTKGLRASDVIARFGGEEFCVLCTNVKDNEAGDLFERIRRSVEEKPLPVPGSPLTVTVSIGATARQCDSLEKMIHKADLQLYRAKNKGRNTVIID